MAPMQDEEDPQPAQSITSTSSKWIIAISSPRLAQISNSCLTAVVLVVMLLAMLGSTAGYLHSSSVLLSPVLVDKGVVTHLKEDLSDNKKLCQSFTDHRVAFSMLLPLNQSVQFGEASPGGTCVVAKDAPKVQSLTDVWLPLIDENGDPRKISDVLASVWEPLMRQQPTFSVMHHSTFHGAIAQAAYTLHNIPAGNAATSFCAQKCISDPLCWGFVRDGDMCRFAHGYRSPWLEASGTSDTAYTIDRTWSHKKRCMIKATDTPGPVSVDTVYRNIAKYAKSAYWPSAPLDVHSHDDRPAICHTILHFYSTGQCLLCLNHANSSCGPFCLRAAPLFTDCRIRYYTNVSDSTVQMLQHLKTTMEANTHNFPCHMADVASCGEYNCFGKATSMCNPDVPCASEVISITTASRDSWLTSALGSSAQMHNYDMFATAMIALAIFTYRKGCFWVCSKKKRSELVDLEKKLLKQPSSSQIGEEVEALHVEEKATEARLLLVERELADLRALVQK